VVKRALEPGTKEHAIELRAHGFTVQQTADAVGVDQTTVNRWELQEPHRRDLGSQREEMWADQQERLRSLVDRAIDVIGEGLDSPSERTRVECARQVLRSVGLFKALPPVGAEARPWDALRAPPRPG
jgi:hypothetical protein